MNLWIITNCQKIKFNKQIPNKKINNHAFLILDKFNSFNFLSKGMSKLHIVNIFILNYIKSMFKNIMSLNSILPLFYYRKG